MIQGFLTAKKQNTNTMTAIKKFGRFSTMASNHPDNLSDNFETDSFICSSIKLSFFVNKKAQA